MSADAPLRNKRVRVVNTSQAALNGQVGLATTFDDGKGRYMVELSGRTVALKPVNLEQVMDDPAAAAAATAGYPSVSGAASSDHSTLSVRQIKDILEAAGVNYSGCTEKSELVKLLTDSRNGAKPASSIPGKDLPPPQPSVKPKPREQYSAKPTLNANAPSRKRTRAEEAELNDELRDGGVRSKSGHLCGCGWKKGHRPNQTKGRKPDGSEGGEDGETIRRVLCAYEDDYCGILGVKEDADDETIRRAYKKLSLRLHPDRCDLTGGKDAFQKLNTAKTALGL